mmetsp:Transcript_23462/g.65805  ORF Transcript_23462/g.65805 Transcript_23462/m.65805 type:complete len:413 (+) Transcript_23462:225-1463(+)
MAQLGDEALLQASESGDLFGVGECLDAGASASAQDANGFTALIKAVANGHTDVVDLLLARGAPVNTPAGTHTALRAATLNGQAALVDKLLKAGADASIVSNNARTPLMGACYPRHGVPEASTKACVELLLNDANGRRTLGWQNDDGDTALHLACFGAPAAALVLAKAGAPRDVLNNRDETPDDLARRAGLRLDPGVPLPLPPAPAPAPPPAPPAPAAPRPKPPQQKAKPPVRVPTGGKYAKPRGRAPLNAEGKPASWDPDLGEWVGIDPNSYYYSVVKKKKPNGIPKPRGRAPLGATWDYDKGEWVGGSGKPKPPGAKKPAPKKKDVVPLTTAEKAAVLHAIAQLDGKATQKKVRRAAESILGAPEGSLDAKKAAVKEVCREEVTRMEDSANAGDAPAAPSIHPSQAMLGEE